MQIDPLVEALAHAHDRIEQPWAFPSSGEEIHNDRAHGQPNGNEVDGPVEQQLDLEDREISERRVPRGDRERLLMRHVYKGPCLRVL